MSVSRDVENTCCSTTTIATALLFAALSAIGMDAETYVVRGSNADKIQVRVSFQQSDG